MSSIADGCRSLAPPGVQAVDPSPMSPPMIPVLIPPSCIAPSPSCALAQQGCVPPSTAIGRSKTSSTWNIDRQGKSTMKNWSGNEKNPRFRGGFSSEKSGGNLLSQGVYPQVPSARSGLTSVFGMGTGVTPTLWPPETCRPSTRVTRRRGLQSKHEHNPSPRPISTGQLHRLPCFHFRPINVVVSPRALLR